MPMQPDPNDVSCFNFLSIVQKIVKCYCKHTFYKFAIPPNTTSQYKGKLKIAKLSLVLLLLFTFTNSFSQQTFRRHFIIAYDVSTPFIISENNCPAYSQALLDLFLNKPIYGYNEAYQDNLNIEKKNGLLFFDQTRDEISFFHFNVAGSEFDSLRWTARHSDEKGIVSEFKKLFLKDKNFNWSTFSSNGSVTPTEYLTTALSMRPNPTNFSGGVSMSNFVYPLVLDKIDTTKYADEYVLIILSDFLTGSMLGNTKDLDRVRDIYQVPCGIELPANSPVSYVKKEIDYLASQYYKIDFFQYSFIPRFTKNPIGIISFKIKPKIGVLTPEDVALFVDGDLSLDQRGYQSQQFKISKTKIKFTHNKNLIPTELRMTVSLPFGNKDTILFDDVIANKDETDKWASKYTNDKDLMNFDGSKLTYYLPSLEISLDSIINKKNFGNLKFKYEFKTKYEIANTQSLNFVYSTERAMPIDKIDYSTKATIIIMYYLLPLLVIIFLIFYLAYYGKPRRLSFRIDGYLDSFEKIDHKTFGKLLTPFKAWDSFHLKDHLLVKGALEFKSSSFPLNWNTYIFLRLQEVIVPDGFEMFLKYNTEDIKEFAPSNAMTIKKGKKNKLSFVVGIRQNDITRQVINPELVKFKVEAVVKDSFLFIKSELRETIDYNFHIGADLGDVWVGFDPGTSGSCVAVGSATDNIILGEDKAKNKIIPSVLVFEKAENFQPNGIEIPEKIYKHGVSAQTLYGTPTKYIGFQSFKKLLGFKDIKEVVFENKNILKLRGKDLAGLLVKGLFKDVSTYCNRPGFNADDYKRDGQFNPLRAVVAIPNNFTTSKIQDMVDCIGNFNQFKEIRYVYEAEAVLFYYLSNYGRLNESEDTLDSETILVFDMGGATINATVVTANKTLVNERPKYDIDFLGKIGYGIGGDTIDYCICKFILSCTDEFPQMKGVHIVENQTQLSALASYFKLEIFRNYNHNYDYLITRENLQTCINHYLNISISISDEQSEMYSHFLKVNGKFKLFSHPFFQKIIYDNITDAVKEVVELSETNNIDKVIFSGRTTQFPFIKETVENILKEMKIDAKRINLNREELKTAVAHGACWYGINKNSVRLNNLKTNAAFGFKKTLSTDKTDVKFYELVEMGCTFDTFNDGIDSFEGSENITDDFAFDGGKVNFYQIMGKDANKILSEGQKHKFSKITSINLPQITSRVGMKVNENDEVECAVKLESNRVINEKGFVSDQEIGDANEEHYTWIVK
jgi:molecular chaperone DnaK (HSP70)